MRARKLALWVGRLAVVAAVGVGAASAGSTGAQAEWDVDTSTAGATLDESTSESPDEARWERRAPDGYSTMLEPWWE